MITKVYPFIKQVYEKQGSLYQNIAMPISDGKKMLNLSVNLQKAYETEGREIAKTLSKNIVLFQIDEHWKQHLRDMDDLRTSVQNAVYEQKDPLVIYKQEGYALFSEMLMELNRDALSFLLRAFIPLRDASEDQQPQRRAPQPARMPSRDMNELRRPDPNQLSTNSGEAKSRMPVRADKKVGRNDPCPCGSGLKYKNCHGKGIV
jgi:preprotein translocase subunit SecA